MKTLHATKVLGVGSAYPSKVLTNDDLAQLVDTNDEWITERSGIKKRHIVSEEEGLYTLDLATQASLRAIEQAGANANEIDFIIFATLTPDRPLPNMASQLQVKLGITNQCGGFDLYAACSGFIYGLNLAHTLIQTGVYKKILVIGAETLSRLVNWQDRGSCILFGDGAGAFLVGRNEAAEQGDRSNIHSFHMGADGSGNNLLTIDVGGVAKPLNESNVADPARYITMSGRDIFKEAVRTLSDSAVKALEIAQVDSEEIDWLVPHQANIRIMDAIVRRLKLPREKMIVNIHEYGNTSAATIPTAFCHGVAEGKIKRGDKVLMVAFGAGLTTASCFLTY